MGVLMMAYSNWDMKKAMDSLKNFDEEAGEVT
jgi:hypothetical protein